jgi:hypothetical protein
MSTVGDHQHGRYRHPTITRVAKAPTRAEKLIKRGQQLASAFETHQDYYAANTQPAYSMFGAPDFVDDEGREYRMAFDISSGPRPESPILALLRMRADASGKYVDATLDDLLARLYSEASAEKRLDEFKLDIVSPGASSRVRLWVRLPSRRHNAKTGNMAWPEATQELATRLTYMGDPAYVDDASPVVVDVIIQNSQRSTLNRKTGYVDVAGMSHDIARALLKRRLRIITGA